MINVWWLIGGAIPIIGAFVAPKKLQCKIPILGAILEKFYYPHEAVVFLERNNMKDSRLLRYAIFTDKEGNQKVKFNKYIQKPQAAPAYSQTLGFGKKDIAFGISTELDTVYWLTPDNIKDKKMKAILKEDKLREQFMVSMTMEMVRDYDKKEKWREIMPLALVVLVMVILLVMSYMALKQLAPLVEAIQNAAPAFKAASASFENAARALGNANPTLPPA